MKSNHCVRQPGLGWWLPMICLLTSVCGAGQTMPPDSGRDLAGTSWKLLRLEDSDGSVRVPDVSGKYTIAFGSDDSVSARIDCNRGRGTWKSPGPKQLELGALALTRAACPQESLYGRIASDWTSVRGYAIRNGHLILSLADQRTYEFEPVPSPNAKTPKSPVALRGPFEFQCTQTGGAAETVKVTYYDTKPGLMLFERGNETRPAFRVASGSGAKYEGENLTFWEWHGEAQVNWSETQLKCKLR